MLKLECIYAECKEIVLSSHFSGSGMIYEPSVLMPVHITFLVKHFVSKTFFFFFLNRDLKHKRSMLEKVCVKRPWTTCKFDLF